MLVPFADVSVCPVVIRDDPVADDVFCVTLPLMVVLPLVAA